MNELVVRSASTPMLSTSKLLAPSTLIASQTVLKLADAIQTRLAPCPFVTEHQVHGGIYTRTIRLPAGTVGAAVKYKVPTTLIIEGSCDVWSNGELTHVDGYSVFRGSADRQIAFVTHTDIKMSMMFATTLTDIAEIQKQFTDEHELLVPLSNADAHVVLITGE